MTPSISCFTSESFSSVCGQGELIPLFPRMYTYGTAFHLMWGQPLMSDVWGSSLVIQTAVAGDDLAGHRALSRKEENVLEVGLLKIEIKVSLENMYFIVILSHNQSVFKTFYRAEWRRMMPFKTHCWYVFKYNPLISKTCDVYPFAYIWPKWLGRWKPSGET